MKQTVEQLAVFGGRPLFATPHLVGRPNDIDRSRFLRRVNEVLDSGMLTNGGPMVSELEKRIAESFGVRHAVAVCNGTVALQIMARATGLTGEVIVPSMTFIATAHALEWVGLTPVFADIDPATFTLDPTSVEACIGPRTSAILGVHLWGVHCDFEALRWVADRHGIRVLYDASHSFGCDRSGNSTALAPLFGDAEAISFHATKVMQAIEGGAVITNDDDIATAARLQRNFGITGLSSVDSIGTNGKLNEICAAAGLTSLEQVDENIEHNNRNLTAYREELASVAGIRVVVPECCGRTNAQYVVATVHERELGLSRDELLHVLRAEGVFARTYFSPGCHRVQPYATNAVHLRAPLLTTEALASSVMQLPTGMHVSQQDVASIGALLKFVSRNSVEIRAKLQSQPYDLRGDQSSTATAA